MKKIFLCALLSFTLVVTGCGSDNDDDPTPIPAQPGTIIDTTKVTLRSNNNVVNLNNTGKAKFSEEYASTNPEITLQKSQSPESKLMFDDSKTLLDIQDGSDYEIGVISSKKLTSEFDIILNVPGSLIAKINETNAIVVYVEVKDDGEQGGGYVPLGSTFDPDTNTVSARVIDWALGNQDVKFKIGLARTYPESLLGGLPDGVPLAAIAAATESDIKSIDLPPAGNLIEHELGTFICPLPECVETSRFGMRQTNASGEMKLHKGIDFDAEEGTPVKSISIGEVEDSTAPSGTLVIAFPSKAAPKIRFEYLHLSSKSVDKGELIEEVGTLLGESGRVHTSRIRPHLHLVAATASLAVKKKKDAPDEYVYAHFDLFPYFMHSAKVVNSSGKSTAVKGDKIKLTLETKTVNGVKLDSLITNRPNDFPIGKVRQVLWSSSNKNVADPIPQKSGSAASGSTTLLNIGAVIEPATITAKWEGTLVDQVEVPYIFNARFKDLDYTAQLVTTSECEGDSGTQTVLGSFVALDAAEPIYRIDARNTTFTETLPATGSKELVYEEDGGTTTDKYIYKIDFDGFDGSGAYQFVKIVLDPETGEKIPSVCNGTYTFKGTFIKPTS